MNTFHMLPILALWLQTAVGLRLHLKDNCRIKQDTVMGIVFSGMFAAGLILYIAVKPDVRLDHILFGDMLGITIGDIIQTVIIAGMVTLVISVKWRDFL